ncbi:MAG: metal ABC transporter substrate-binding protein [Sporichthyaceae bacterium]
MISMTKIGMALGAVAATMLVGCAGPPSEAAPPSGIGSSAPSSAGPRVQTLAAFYPYYWVAQRVGGPAAQIELLTAAGVEPHDLELSPKQVERVGEVDLLVYQKGFQPALDAAVDRQGPAQVLELNGVLRRQPVVDEPAEEEGRSGEEKSQSDAAPVDLAVDPHVWLDADKLAAIATATSDAMSRISPEGAAGFQSRAAEVRADLATLDGEFRNGLRGCRRADVVVSHAAFGHLTARYGLTQVPVNGITPEAAPSPQRLAELAELIRRAGATTVFTETLASPRLAETLAAEAGVKTATLDPLEGLVEGDGRDYLSVMRENLSALRAGLDCSGAAPVPSSSPFPTASTTDSPFPPQLSTPRSTTQCSSVVAPPEGIEVDTTHDPENGVLEFGYRDYRGASDGLDRYYAIDYRNDPTCRQDPRIRALIEHAEEASRDGQR